MNHPPVIFGLETEIGLAVERPGESDLVDDSIALVRSATEPGVWLRWDYQTEDPHWDMRGFRVQALRQDHDEADFAEADCARPLTYVDLKSDLVLANGARFYNDHAHPEYCTPECHTLAELVAHDRAGERILMRCAQNLQARDGFPVRLYKNNTDFAGHSYGCHENYLLARALPWEALVRGVQAFLVTRQIIAGAGKFALEAEDRLLGSGFQLSQRSDFFTELQSVDTMQRRPLINTRDEPHANPRIYRRFHVILGDANMSAFATRLKVGTTALVLEALALDPKGAWPRLADPLGALGAVSRDESFRWPVELEGGRRSSAVAVQRQYLEQVRRLCDLDAPERRSLADDWAEALNDLETDWSRCRDRLDWVAKRELIGRFQEQHGLKPDDPWLMSLDLEYHRLDLTEGLFFGLEQAGQFREPPPESAVLEAITQPPTTTRALIRGRCVQKFGPQILAAQWDHMILQGRAGPVRISLEDVFHPADLRRLARAVETARTPDDLADV